MLAIIQNNFLSRVLKFTQNRKKLTKLV